MSESEKKIKKQFYQFSPQRVLKAAAMATLKKPVDLEQPHFFKNTLSIDSTWAYKELT